MDYNKSKRVSILNNDDNPSFAVPRSAPKSRGSYAPDERQHVRSSALIDDGSRKQSSEQSAMFNYPHSQASSLQFQSHFSRPQSPPGDPDMRTNKLNKKNKYPCPYAASHSCSATFTTSGHAARHGKTHTGEKSVHCPVCNKAFTRKDNMKQHQRTHRVIERDGSPSTQGAWSEACWPHGRMEPYAFSPTEMESPLSSAMGRPGSWSNAMDHGRHASPTYNFK